MGMGLNKACDIAQIFNVLAWTKMGAAPSFDFTCQCVFQKSNP